MNVATAREEVEELLVAWAEGARHIPVTGGGEDNSSRDGWHRSAGRPSLTPSEFSSADSVRSIPQVGEPRPSGSTLVSAARPARHPPRGGVRPADPPGRAPAGGAGRPGHPGRRRPGVLQERRRPARAAGPPRARTPLSYSFCRHVVASGAPLVVEDARRDPARPQQPGRSGSWAGSRTPAYRSRPRTASTAGALCVIDALPRIWSPRDVALLEDLAASVATEIEIRTPRSRLPGVQLPPPPVAPPARDPTAGVFDASALPMGLLRSDGRWLRVNRALGELVGWSPEALTDCPADALTHPLDRGADAEAMRLILAGECSSYTCGETPRPGRRRRGLGPLDGHARPGWRRRAGPVPRGDPGHLRPQAGRRRPARARGALPARRRSHAGRGLGLGPPDRPAGLGRARRRRLRILQDFVRPVGRLVVRAPARRRPRARRDGHAGRHRRGRQGVGRCVPLPAGGRELRPGAGSRHHRPGRGG